MFRRLPLGALSGGFLARWIIPQFGWRSLLPFGGVAPLVLAVAMFVLLAESVRYLVPRSKLTTTNRVVLARISTRAAHAPNFAVSESYVSTAGCGGLGVMLSAPYPVGRVPLWIASPWVS